MYTYAEMTKTDIHVGRTVSLHQSLSLFDVYSIFQTQVSMFLLHVLVIASIYLPVNQPIVWDGGYSALFRHNQ